MSDVPAATVVKDGKLPGDVPSPNQPRPKYKRRLSNYLLDKKLQLRYVLLVTILSAVIAGALGFLIYRQEHAASASLEKDLQELTATDSSRAEFESEVAGDLEAQDHALIFKMVGVGVGLVVILSAYLVIMTHKVAGPLYKVSLYFDKMADKRLGVVTALRKGDMLQDFYDTFRVMHDAVRAKQLADVGVIDKAAAVLRASGATHPELAAELTKLEAHVEARKKQLA